MSFQATVRLRGDTLELSHSSPAILQTRKLAYSDRKLFTQWSERHQALAKAHDPAAGLLKLGSEMFEWLNGKDQFLHLLINGATVPLLIRFQMDKVDDRAPANFLDAPWELLADNNRHWALRADTLFCPVRVIGESLNPKPPSTTRLSLVFMAAAPRGADDLAFELEEASRLDGICFVGLDLGQLLCRAGQTNSGRTILTRSRDGFLNLGQDEMAEQAQSLLARWPESDS